MKQKIILIGLILFSLTSVAQEKYWVFLSDKDGVEFDPYSYFDENAIERRIQNGVSLYDATDFPVRTDYANTVSELVDEVTFESRWFNALAVLANQEQIEKVSELSFVKNVEQMYMTSIVCEKKYDYDLSESQMNLLKKQTSRLGRELFHEAGFKGKGIRIAVFDDGFLDVDKIEVFQHIRDNNRIIATYDFTKKKEDVYYTGGHGVATLSNIAGIHEGIPMGLATEAEFLLAKTEINREPFSEEENWLAAVEWADKNGAHIISSSLGYTHNRYFPKDMDGKTSLVSHAANMAARKGILVVNSAGNEGSSKNWMVIGAPADADSVLAIGGINPKSDNHINFSSFGPTSDGRMKPNVSAYGTTVAARKGGLKTVSGTSFSCPLVAGFAACAWQTNKKLTNMELFKEIEKSGNLYPYYDYAHGYGIPQADYFVSKKAETKPTFKFINDNTTIKVIVDENAQSPSLFDKGYLYYHISDKNGYLSDYKLIEVYQKRALELPVEDFESGQILRVHYKGYTNEYKF